MVTIRGMKPCEADEIKKTALRSFGIIERLVIGRPKEAMVAEVDGKIAGGIILKYINAKGKKIGYFDVAFIAPEYQGQGIGKKLYKETTAYLWQQGCDMIFALVKDDNVGSWKLFLENGLLQSTIREGIRQMGIRPMLSAYFTTPFWAGNGMEFYLAAKTHQIQAKAVRTCWQIVQFLLVNLLLMLPSVCNSVQPVKFTAAYFSVLAVSILGGYIGTLFSRLKWKFRFNSGGAVMSFLINLIGFYPMAGNWYPEKYEKTPAFRRAMGRCAVSEWLFMLVLTSGAVIFEQRDIFFHYLGSLSGTLLSYHILVFYPYEVYGGRRVYLWKKWGYGLLAALSVYIIAVF